MYRLRVDDYRRVRGGYIVRPPPQSRQKTPAPHHKVKQSPRTGACGAERKCWYLSLSLWLLVAHRYLIVHRGEELQVGLSQLDALLEELHRLYRIHVR